MSIARAIGDATRITHRARRTAAPYEILASPDENLVGCARDDKCQPWRRAVTPPAAAETTPAGLPPIRSARASRDTKSSPRGLAITYSLLLDGSRAVRDPRFLLAAETSRPPARRRSVPEPGSCSMMLHIDGDAAPDRPLCICSKMRHIRRGVGDPRPADEDRSGPCACAHVARVQAMVCAQIHTRRIRHGVRPAARSGSRVFSGRSPHDACSSGQPSVDRLRDHLLTCARCWPLAKRRLVRTSS
jgi:hypothetical protein